VLDKEGKELSSEEVTIADISSLLQHLFNASLSSLLWEDHLLYDSSLPLSCRGQGLSLERCLQRAETQRREREKGRGQGQGQGEEHGEKDVEVMMEGVLEQRRGEGGRQREGQRRFIVPAPLRICRPISCPPSSQE
jgi:hypothetical protein